MQNAADEVKVNLSQRQRQAALLLHSLSQTDREWALAKLEPLQREKMLAGLQELQSLGIPSDSTFADDAISCSDNALLDTESRIKYLANVPAPVMVKILSSEGVGFVAPVLAIAQWPWSEAIRSAMPVALRTNGSLAPGLRDDIAEVLVNAVAANGYVSNSYWATSWLQRIRRMLKVLRSV